MVEIYKLRHLRFVTVLLLLLYPSIVSAARSTGVTDGKTWVTVDSITWTMDAIYSVGQYATLDYYVVCPEGCSVVAIAPSWDGNVNGSTLNPTPGGYQGYHSSAAVYDVAYNDGATLPIAMVASDNLVSTTDAAFSYCESIWDEIAGGNRQMCTYVDEAAILNVVAVAPSGGSFRPGYCNTSITHNTSNIDYTELPKLTVVGTPTALATVEDLFARPWIDHTSGWEGRQSHPYNNMADYGMYMQQRIGLGAVSLVTNYTDEELEVLLINYIQLGIDLYSIVTAGGGWYNDGGHANGRKWPILFAGILLGDTAMKNIGTTDTNFGEDMQTFYVEQSDIDITTGGTWNPDDRNPNPNTVYTTEMIGMPEWGIRHGSNPEMSDSSWTAMYRECCTNFTAKGIVLAAHVMGAKVLWNHDALFDYQDRYEAIMKGEQDPFGYTVPDEGAGYYTGGFVGAMWDEYREDYKYHTGQTQQGTGQFQSGGGATGTLTTQ